MDTTTPTATSLPRPEDIDLTDTNQRPPMHWNTRHGDTIVLRTRTSARAEELFMERSRSRRMVRALREQLGKAKRRRSKATPVPLDVLDALLTRIENADA